MTGQTAEAALIAAAGRALDRPCDPHARAMAEHLAARPGAVAVLFYGNRLRDPEAAGLLDLYVLTESDRAWHGRGLAALANRLLPPNVYHERLQAPPVAAKVAVMSLAAFRARMRANGADTTLWARFAQPAALLWARDAAAARAVAAAIAAGWRIAARWADRLAEEGGGRWTALFAATYGAELRPESTARPGAVVAAEPDFYAMLDRLIPPEPVPAAEAARARRAWRRRRLRAKALNLARLIKAAFTYRGAVAYALDKVERHGGAPVPLSPWERRLPWLAAPLILARLWWRGRLR